MACGQVVLQQPVDEDVAAAHLAEEEALGGIIQETNIVPGCGVVMPECQTEHQMLEAGPPPYLSPVARPTSTPTSSPLATPTRSPAPNQLISPNTSPTPNPKSSPLPSPLTRAIRADR